LDHGKARDPSEIAEIDSSETIAEVKGGGADQKIREGDTLSFRKHLAIDLAGPQSDGHVNGIHGSSRQQIVKEALARRAAFQSIRAPQPMGQFEDGHYRNRNFGVAATLPDAFQHLIGTLAPTFCRDDHA